MNRIIYATDFSVSSIPALKYTYELSQKADAKLVVLHIYEVPTIWNSPTEPGTFQDIDHDTREVNINQLKDFVNENLDSADQNAIEFEAVGNAKTADGIIGVANDQNADLVVMGTKGKSMVREILMGSVAKRMIKESACPVICIPPDYQYKAAKKVVYASDLESDEVPAIHFTSALAGLFDAKTFILHVTEEDRGKEKENMKEFEANLNFEDMAELVYGITDSANIHKYLTEYIKENEIDMIAMFERHESRFYDVIFGKDEVEQMEAKINIPFMTFNKRSLEHISKKTQITTKLNK